MTAKPVSLGARVTKAIRVRGDAARYAYHAARRAGGLLRDRPRRAALRALAPAWFDITKADGFLVLPPGSFAELPEVVAEAHATLARFESEGRAAPDSWKRFLVNVLDPSEVDVLIPEPDGISADELEALMSDLASRTRIAGMGVTGLLATERNAALATRMLAAAGF